MPAAEAAPDDPAGLTGAGLEALFAPFLRHARILLAVSGGPDSTALMLLAQRWREGRDAGPELAVATVDHGLRPEARAEAEAVSEVAARLGLPHAVLELSSPLPRARLQEAARHARYEALLAHARAIGAGAVATAHTLDDQAETVLFRLIRGSGVGGLAGIPAERALEDVELLRPLLALSKTALIEECRHAEISFAEDPSNRDPRFARARLRALLPALAEEGLDASALARFAARMARTEAALEAATDAAGARLWPAEGPIRFARPGFGQLPAEIGLRLLGRAVEAVADGPVELGKLEALHGWIAALHPESHGARTLAGALVRVNKVGVTVSAAPARRSSGGGR